MLRRFAIAFLILVVGSGLVALAVARNGLPWQFGAREAVVLEVSGSVELRFSSERVERERRDKRVLPLVVDDALFPGDRVQVGSLSFARLTTSTGVLGLDTHTNVVFQEDWFAISRGRVEVDLFRPAQLHLEGGDKERVTLSTGRYLAQAGGGVLGVLVYEGAASRGDLEARAGEVLLLDVDGDRVINRLDQDGVHKLVFEHEDSTLRGEAAALTQIFVNANGLAYPERGKWEMPAPTGDKLVVIARDVFGRSATLTLAESPRRRGR